MLERLLFVVVVERLLPERVVERLPLVVAERLLLVVVVERLLPERVSLLRDVTPETLRRPLVALLPRVAPPRLSVPPA